MKDRYKFNQWIDFSFKLIWFGFLPIKFAEKLKNDSGHIFWGLIAPFWFIITLPLEVVLFIPSSICFLIALTYA